MNLITNGAIALITHLLNKTLDKAEGKIADKIIDQVLSIVKRNNPETGNLIEKVADQPELVQQQPADYGEAVLVEKLEASAKIDPEIKAALEQLAKAVESNPKMTQVIENWKGINIKGGNPTINNPVFNFND